MDLVITATRCESSDDCATDYYCESTGCVFTYTCPVRKHEVVLSLWMNDWDINISVATTTMRVVGRSEIVFGCKHDALHAVRNCIRYDGSHCNEVACGVGDAGTCACVYTYMPSVIIVGGECVLIRL